MTTLDVWAHRWGVAPEALADLRTHLEAPAPPAGPNTEASVVGAVRLLAAQSGYLVFRNNVGACYDTTGRFIRYGLANDSAQLNKSIKSSDLIGLRPVTIDSTHLGRTFGQFVALECKRSGWKFKGTARELAQEKFLALVTANGGHARFTTGGL